MKEFVMAALPWMLIGLALTVLAADFARKESEEALEKKRHRLLMGALAGILLGAVLNSLGLWENDALGYGVGPLWGAALAALFGGKNKRE